MNKDSNHTTKLLSANAIAPGMARSTRRSSRAIYRIESDREVEVGFTVGFFLCLQDAAQLKR